MLAIKKKIKGVVLVGMILSQIVPVLALPAGAEENQQGMQIDNVIDLNSAPKLKVKKSISVETNGKSSVQIMELESKTQAPARQNRQLSGESLTPLIANYAGIEKNTADYILYYLSQNQNEDGSFGEINKYETTAGLVFQLIEYNKTESGQFNSALQYLLNTAPANNREKALKARILIAEGQNATPLLDELKASQDNSGGIGFDTWHESDLQTTMEAVLAFSAGNYNSGNAFSGSLFFVLKGISSEIGNNYSTYKIAQGLKPFSQIRAGTDTESILVSGKINEILQALNVGEESSDVFANIRLVNIFNLYDFESAKAKTFLASIKRQRNFDGSFGNSILHTTEALKSFATPNLVIEDLQNIGASQTRETATFRLTVMNKGYKQADNIVLYHFVDNFLRESKNLATFGLGAIAPGQSVNLNFNQSDTSSFVGPTQIKFYLEEPNDANYDDNWIEREFNFTPSVNGLPGLPTYYVAQKYQINGNPAVNIRWARKDDPARLLYVFVYRPVGATNWSYLGINNDWNGAFVSSFPEDTTYEVTAGVLSLDGGTVTFLSDYTTITMSSDQTKYNGYASGQTTVNNEPGPNLSIFAYGYGDKSDQDGRFNISQSTTGNGSNAAWVSSSGYESLITKFNVPIGATTTDIRLLTRLKPDVIRPTVTFTQISGEEDYELQNQREVNIVAEGSDNVAIKESDFWYWNALESVWQYLGTKINNSYQAIFPWYISEDIKGNGFKIKTASRDYQGNESPFTEWGPFNVVEPIVEKYSISGRLKYYDGIKSIKNTKVILTDEQGNALKDVLTDQNGFYQFNDLPSNASYAVRVEKSGGDSQVNILDIVKTVRHILGKEDFDSIYKKIAADTDNDGAIVGLDITAMVRYILRSATLFPAGNWKFFDSNLTLTPSNYTNAEQARRYENLNDDLTNQDFIGVKTGDVNNSWNNN